MWQSVNAVRAYPSFVVKIDERQLDFWQGVYAVRERLQCLRLDKAVLTVKDAPSVALVRQLLLDSHLADALALHRVSAVRANTVALRAQADDAVDRLTIAFVLHLTDDFFVARTQFANFLLAEDGMC